MKIFVWEYLSSGAYGEELLPTSLLKEGQSMLFAAIRDFSRRENVTLFTIRDSRLDEWNLPGVVIHSATSLIEEDEFFSRCSQEADYVFLIAPEFDRILSDRVKEARKHCDQVLLSSGEMIDLCSDKFQTAKRLRENGVPAIKTERFNFEQIPDLAPEQVAFPFVLKPIDGAGSMNTILVHDQEQIEILKATPDFHRSQTGWISQPFVKGDSFSVAAIRGMIHDSFQVFPVARQEISHDGMFQYSGGKIPCERIGTEKMLSIVQDIMNSFPELRGYVGFDFVLPEEKREEPVLLEINPRLTTSFIGYTNLTDESILGNLLLKDSQFSPVQWKAETVSFCSSGEISGKEVNQCM